MIKNDICVTLKQGVYLEFIIISCEVFLNLRSSGFITSTMNKILSLKLY